MSDAPDDSGWVWIPDRKWRTPSAYTRCRWSPRDLCPNPPVADLRRSWRGAYWWAYCERHLFGRRLRESIVEVRVRSDSPAAERGYLDDDWSARS